MESIDNSLVFPLITSLQIDSLPRGLIGNPEWQPVLLRMSQVGGAPPHKVY